MTPLTDGSLDDITPPPGGGSAQRIPNAHPERQRQVPWPDYLSHEGRDLRLDLLRGFFVVAMIIDHVRGYSPLYFLTGGNRFYTSAAEGFILISGLVAGLVYRRLIQREGMSAALLKVLKRALTLFLLTVGLTLPFILISELFYLPWAQGVDLSNPIGLVVSVLTLHRTYFLVDVMLLYTVLFLISPMAFVLLDRGKARLLLLISVTLYVLYQFFPDYALLPWPIDGNYLFTFSAWQLLFFGGMALGYNSQQLPSLTRQGTRNGLIMTGLATAAMVVLFLVIDQSTFLTPAVSGNAAFNNARLWIQDNIFAKVDLGPGRLVASAVTFSFLFLLITYFWRPVRHLFGWLLLPLGQQALYSYTLHVVLVCCVALALNPFNLASQGPWWLNLLIQAGSILLIWVLVKRQFLAPTKRTRRWYNLSPAVISIAVILLLLRFPAPSHPGINTAAAAPDPSNGRVAMRNGTPIAISPLGSPEPIKPVQQVQGTPAPASAADAQALTPTVEPTHLVNTRPGSDVVVSAYLGDIEGSLLEHWFYSPELNQDMPYYIYFPPDYDSANRRYPVLYLLHGLGGHREEWVVYGLIDVADQLISNGDIPPMIIVLPQGDRGYWTDHTADGPRWGAYVWHDLVDHVDATYRTLRSPQARAIGGLSMGGWGALGLAFSHPEIFGIAGGHSPSLRPDDGVLDFLGKGAEYDSKDPVMIAAIRPGLENLQVWIDAGQDDPYLARDVELRDILLNRGIPTNFEVYSGGHDYEYWHGHVIDYMRFYGAALTHK